MKKLKFLFIVALLAMGSSAFAQSVTINNHTDFTVSVTMYASSPVYCLEPCGYMVGNTITVAPSYPLSTGGTPSPCNFSNSPGWSLGGCIGTSTYAWCSSPGTPSDFEWDYAYVEIHDACLPIPDYTCYVGYSGCGGSSTPTLLGGCSGSDYATWTYSGSDVTIDIYQ